jgi:hypothetical protein
VSNRLASPVFSERTRLHAFYKTAQYTGLPTFFLPAYLTLLFSLFLESCPLSGIFKVKIWRVLKKEAVCRTRLFRR